jgi:hypothetical protein
MFRHSRPSLHSPICKCIASNFLLRNTFTVSHPNKLSHFIEPKSVPALWNCTFSCSQLNILQLDNCWLIHLTDAKIFLRLKILTELRPLSPNADVVMWEV